MPLKRNRDVLARRLEDGLVLVHLNTNRVIELNETGARIWDLVESGADEEVIVQTLLEEFEVEREHLRRDVRSVMDQLIANELLTTEPGRAEP